MVEMKQEFIKFSLVGLAATITTYAVLVVLVEGAGLDAVVSSVIGYVAGAGVNYALNYRYTFKSEQRHRVAVPRFAVVIGIGMVLNAVIMALTVNALGIHYLLAQLIAVAFVLMWSFTLNRMWSFS